MATASDFKVQAEKLEGPDNGPCGNTPHTQYPLYLTTAPTPLSLSLSPVSVQGTEPGIAIHHSTSTFSLYSLHCSLH